MALRPQQDTVRGPGLGLVAEIMFGPGPGSNDRNQTPNRTFRALSICQFFFRKEKAIRSCAQLMLVAKSGSRYKFDTDSIFREF
jgi:hypothetical protein